MWVSGSKYVCMWKNMRVSVNTYCNVFVSAWQFLRFCAKCDAIQSIRPNDIIAENWITLILYNDKTF